MKVISLTARIKKIGKQVNAVEAREKTGGSINQQI